MPPDNLPTGTGSPPETHQEGAVNLSTSEILKLGQVLGYDFFVIYTSVSYHFHSYVTPVSIDTEAPATRNATADNVGKQTGSSFAMMETDQ